MATRLVGADLDFTWRQTEVNGTVGSDDLLWTSFGATVGQATETSAGKIELATQAEVNAGSDTERAVTPATLSGYTGFTRKYSTSIGDGSNTSYTVTHNLGSRDVTVAVFRNSGNYDEILVETRHDTTNTAVIVFAAAPSSNQVRVVVTGCEQIKDEAPGTRAGRPRQLPFLARLRPITGD